MSAVPVSSLIGKISAATDLQVSHQRVRYLQSTTVGPSQYFRMVFPRLGPNYSLDCRDINMRTTVTVTSSDGSIAVDTSPLCPFSRCRVLCGSTVIADFLELHLLMQLLYNSQQSVSISAYEQSLIGDGNLAARQGWAAAAKEYIFPFMPQNTVMRGNHLIPLEMLHGDLVIEFWTLAANQFLYSPSNVTSSTYSLGTVEILCTYLQSPSIASYLRSTPFQFTCFNYDYRYQTITDQVSQIRLSSSSTSLNVILMTMRDQNVDTTINTSLKQQIWNCNSLSQYALLVNGQQFFDQPVSSIQQMFHELLHALPDAAKAVFFTSAYSSTRFLLAIRLAAAPEEFAEHLTSGIPTKALNQDSVITLTFGSSLGSTERVDSYMQSDVLIYIDPNTKELNVKY